MSNEINGLKWYCKISGNKIDLIKFNKNTNFYYLDIKFFEGKKNIFYKSLLENENLISRAIDHYADIWPKKSNIRCHGDLTIDNIIYNKNEVKFIDWEMSGVSNEPWGYDLVYLLISSIFFPFEIKKTLDDNEKVSFTKLWNKLKKLNISDNLLKDPFNFLISAHKKKEWRVAIKDHPKKIYPNLIKKDFKNILKELIN